MFYGLFAAFSGGVLSRSTQKLRKIMQNNAKKMQNFNQKDDGVQNWSKNIPFLAGFLHFFLLKITVKIDVSTHESVQ